MNLEQLIKEEVSFYHILRYANKEELDKLKELFGGPQREENLFSHLDFSKGWFVNKDKSFYKMIVVHIRQEGLTNTLARRVKYCTFTNTSNKSRPYEYNGISNKGSDLDKAIENWEFLQTVSPETRESFGDLLDIL